MSKICCGAEGKLISCGKDAFAVPLSLSISWSCGASMVLAPEIPEILEKFRKPVSSVPFCRCFGTVTGEFWLLLPWCSKDILSVVGGPTRTLDGPSGPSLFTATVPELECSSWARFCGTGVANGLEFRWICPLRLRMRCFAELWPPALGSAQSGVCEIPGVPRLWIGACGRAHGFCSINCSCASRSFCAKELTVGPGR